MIRSDSTMAQQIGQAALAFEQIRTGHTSESVTVVLSDNTLVITLHGALSRAEKALASTPAGAAQVQEFHRQLFRDSANTLSQDIQRITGIEVREDGVEIVTARGTVVQVFLLARNVPEESWSGSGSINHS